MFPLNVNMFKNLKFPHRAKILNVNNIVQKLKKNNAKGETYI